MDVASVVTKFFEISPLVGVFASAVYVLWNTIQKKEQLLMDTMKNHDDDRKTTQDKVMQIVNQNSVSNLQLSTSVDNLSRSVTESGKDTANRLAAVESKIDKTNRVQRASVPSKTVPA